MGVRQWLAALRDSTLLTAALGQLHALPQCNSNGRFTSISGHKRYRWASGRRQAHLRYAAEGQWHGRVMPLRCAGMPQFFGWGLARLGQIAIETDRIHAAIRAQINGSW